jgi:HAD superfamily hydrolase (TIGR01509 family)
MIKAIVFDCFGVLATDGWLPFKQKYIESDKAIYKELTKENVKADGGLLAYDYFIKKVASLTGLNETEVKAQIERNIPDYRIFDYIADNLKGKYKIGMLSNAGQNFLDRIFTKEEISLFDAVAISYDIGAVKPNPEAYEIIAKKLDVDVSECVIIDDQERYCLGATGAGMRAVWYKDISQMKNELKDILS